MVYICRLLSVNPEVMYKCLLELQCLMMAVFSVPELGSQNTQALLLGSLARSYMTFRFSEN